MYKIITLLFLFSFSVAQAQVNCNLTYERTLQTFNVYIHNPSGATLYRAKMAIDADGSPRAYGPNNSGLDWTANAGSPGNWWGIATDVAGNPIIQSSTDPYPGMYVSTTSLVDANYAQSNPLRYVNSETVPFIAMPTSVLTSGNIHVGDVAYVYNTTNGLNCFAIYADAGPSANIGEASIYTATQLGVNPNARTGGTSLGIIDYVVFPQSGFGQGYIPTIAQIDSIGNVWLNKPSVGGPCIVSCIGPMFNQTPPTTIVSVPAGWDTTAFTANFTDAFSGCSGGIERKFYQVSDYNLSNDWRANNTHGFFNEDFNAPSINAEWTMPTGTWSINSSNYLQQLDETVTNTNIYAPLTQNLSNEYLYSWTGTMGGTGVNRRAGFHFFADQPDSTNRGNSYFVWFRLDDDRIQTYKSVNNSWGSSPVNDTAYNFNANQAYDFKVTYNRISGVIRVYVNDVKRVQWKDVSPFSNGGYISFRNANCTYKIDNFKVFRSRTSTANISVGAGNTKDIRFQNQNPSTPAGKVSSIAVDSSGNISAINSQNVNIDFTHPSASATINDGSASDIDTTFNGTQLQANWSASTDLNSGIANYYYAIGTTPGANNIKAWTSISTTSVTLTGLSLVHLQKYYVSVQAGDAALMRSSVVISDGQLYFNPTSAIQSQNHSADVTIFPNPNNGSFTIKSSGEGIYSIVNGLGQLIETVKLTSANNYSVTISDLQDGIYFITGLEKNNVVRKKIVVAK